MRVLVLAALAACSGDDALTGAIQRFAVDRIEVPRTSDEADAMGADLDGNGSIDNKLGSVTTVLAGTNDLSIDAASMIAAGSLASVMEIQADDVMHDPSAGVRYLGADGDPADVVRGTIDGGVFHVGASHASARVRLPIYTNADPLALPLDGLAIELSPDGAGGYTALVRGGIPAAAAADAAYAGLLQMVADEPQRHIVFARLLDGDRDGTISREEFDSSVITLLIAPDLGSPKDHVSVGFRAHLVPCPTGTCASGTPADACRDRVRDGDETDVDCGGACQPCAAASSCAQAADCQSQACDAGHCRAPSCSDGVRDGLETDVDCGDSCMPCAAGRSCVQGVDCASGTCSAASGTAGTCQ